MRFLDYWGGVLLAPREWFKVILSEGGGFKEAFLTVLVFGTIKWASIISSLRHFVRYFVPVTVPVPMGLIGDLVRTAGALLFAVGIIADFIVWLLWGLVAYILMRLMGGAGDLEPTMAVLGFTWIFMVPALVPLALTPWYPLSGIVVALFVRLLTYLWSFYVAGMGLSEAHGVNLARGILAVILPAFLPIALILLAAAAKVLLSTKLLLWW